MDDQKTYGPKRVCQVVGISHRQLGYWGLIGVIKPTKRVCGSKVFNHYTDEDIETLKKVKQLTEEGFFVSKAAERVHRKVVEPPTENGAQPKAASEAERPVHQSEPSSSLYFEARLYEELAAIRHHYRPLSLMAVQIVFPSYFKTSSEKNRILLQLSKILISQKQPSETLCYKDDSIFVWLLPNRTLEQAKRFSNEIKKIIEESQWETPDRNFKLKSSIGFSGYSFLSKKEENLLIEAERNLHGEKSVKQMRNGAGGS